MPVNTKVAKNKDLTTKIETEDLLIDKDMIDTKEITKEQVVTNEEREQQDSGIKLDMNSFLAPEKSDFEFGEKEKGVLTIVNSTKNGKRVTFPKDVCKELFEDLENANTLNLAFNNEVLIAGQNLPCLSTQYPLKKQGAKKIIYSAPLVKQLTETYNLDFENTVSITFHDVEYQKIGEDKIAIFKMIN